MIGLSAELRNQRSRDDLWRNQTLPLTRPLSWPWLQNQQTRMLKISSRQCLLQLIVCNIQRTHHCGDKQSPVDCKFKTAECHKCGKKGHIARACRSKQFVQEPRPSRKATPHAANVLTEDSSDYYSMYNLTGTSIKPLKVIMTLNNRSLKWR